MTKEEQVISYYALCNTLKDVIRSGWKDWNVKRERVESVAEHIYGVQMLAIFMHSIYNYDIDIKKVIYMLAVHELGETVIGDLTLFQITKEEKEKIEHEAIHKILKDLINGPEIENILLEFDERKTKEAYFAYQCDKLECDLQSKLYDQGNCVDLNNQPNNKSIQDERVATLLKQGSSFSDMWLAFGREIHSYDKNFKAVSNYASNHEIEKIKIS